MTVGRIVDVASYQHPNNARINWAAVKAAGFTTAIIKVTERTGYVNPYWAGGPGIQSDRDDALAAGLDVLGYHFAGFGDVNAELRWFLSHAGGTKYGRILDIETSLNAAWARAFLQGLGLGGDQMCTYGSASTLGQIRARIPGVTWPAAYGQGYPGWGVMWQFTSSAQIPGIVGNADESSWHGTDLQYEALFGLNDPPPPTPAPPSGVEMIAPTHTGNGYWICKPDGAIDSFGDATYLGGANAPNPLPAGHVVTGFTAHPSAPGYWIEAGGLVYAFGAAKWFGNAT